MTESRTFEGGCHCGNVKVTVQLVSAPLNYELRACDCDFCTKHRAVYLSDPQGKLVLYFNDDNKVGIYKHGADLAEMIFCPVCGVYIGALYKEPPEIFGAVNARIFSEGFGPEVVVSPKLLGPDEKTARWKDLWFSDVQVINNVR